MAYKQLLVAVTMIAAASPSAASQTPPGGAAPVAGPDARYCLRIEAITGTRLEEVKCWTRLEWAEHEVDLDKEWAREGVGTIEGGVRRPVEG